MKKSLLNLICCPKCKKKFVLKILKEDGGETEEGLLTCECGEFFPIVNYIPRILTGDLRSVLYGQFSDFFLKYKNILPKEELSTSRTKEARKKKETAESFAYEWEMFSSMLKEWKNNFDFYFEPVKDINALKDKTVLEVGCGKGRHTFYVADIAKEVVAVDFGRAVDVALANNKNKNNVHFVQADIYRMPFRESFFAFVFCIGVLHHLPTPEQGFKKLVSLVKPGGEMLIYVYHSFSKKTFNYYLLKIVNFFRNITTRLPYKVLHFLCYPIAFLSYIILILPYKLLFKHMFSKKAWPLAGYEEYPFQVILNDTFDRFSAPIENRYSKEQVVNWYNNASLEDVNILGGSGWRIVGKRI